MTPFARSRSSAATPGPRAISSRRPSSPDWPAPGWTYSGWASFPTPGVAHLTRALNADFGVVLSASHNPAADNGIKFFGRGGVKLADEAEDEIEAALLAVARRPRRDRIPGRRRRPGSAG